jgi:hypothetical protein
VVEHFLGKEEVWGSIPHNGSIWGSRLVILKVTGHLPCSEVLKGLLDPQKPDITRLVHDAAGSSVLLFAPF